MVTQLQASEPPKDSAMDHLELPVFFEDLRKIATRVEEISCALDEGKFVDPDGLDFKVSPRLFSHRLCR